MIWSSSYVLLKIGLGHLGPLTIAGLRYSFAFLILLPFIIRNRASSLPLPTGIWFRLIGLGISAYVVGNGALVFALKYLPATIVSFLMSLLPLFMLFAGVVWLKEHPTRQQVLGLVLSLVGGGLFFWLGLRPGEPNGIAIMATGLIGFTLFGIIGRDIAKRRRLDTLTLTALPLAVGGGVLMLIAVLLEGIPSVSPYSWAIVLWLAVVNTASAYLLYNHSLQVLTALEMTVMLSLSPLATAVLGWLLLDEVLVPIQIVGMVIVIIGVVLVQRTSIGRIGKKLSRRINGERRPPPGQASYQLEEGQGRDDYQAP